MYIYIYIYICVPLRTPLRLRLCAAQTMSNFTLTTRCGCMVSRQQVRMEKLDPSQTMSRVLAVTASCFTAIPAVRPFRWKTLCHTAQIGTTHVLCVAHLSVCLLFLFVIAKVARAQGPRSLINTTKGRTTAPPNVGSIIHRNPHQWSQRVLSAFSS